MGKKKKNKKMEKNRSRIGFVKECYKITTAYISHLTNTPTHKAGEHVKRERDREEKSEEKEKKKMKYH
jgi:hypothetical protein